jgi:hypothetical protein
LLKNLCRRLTLLATLGLPLSSCATSIEWEGKLSTHVSSYMQVFDQFRGKVCVPKAESVFQDYLKAYRGQGYWIPEFNDDVDVETIRTLLPEFEKKLSWIKAQKARLKMAQSLPKNATAEVRSILRTLLALKRYEVSSDEAAKTRARKESLLLMGKLQLAYDKMIKKVSFLSNYSFPVDHLKNRKVYDQHREKDDPASVKMANYTFLYRKLLEDAAYNKDQTGSDIYLRTTLDTLFFELREHGFYISEDARFDLEFVLGKIDSELKRGKDKLLERLTEWEERAERGFNFYRSMTLPENLSRNRQIIKEHNRNTEKLKEYVYRKQAEVYAHWLNQSELNRAVFVLETILMNEVGGVDGEDALERMDVARVVLNRLDKPKYLAIGKKEFIYPYLQQIATQNQLKHERWLNALFKQGEFSFTYYYMSGVAHVFCPDLAPGARRLRDQNVKIALQVLKEADKSFKATRYFSRASMIGRIHMDTVWEDYRPYPERPGLMASGQTKLLKSFKQGNYTYLYSFEDPTGELYQVLEIEGKNYALNSKHETQLFYNHRNPHYFKYFIKIESPHQ